MHPTGERDVMLIQALFYLFATILVLGALGVIVARNPVYSALLLVLCFLTSAAIWLLVEAEFLAVVLVLVYVGAVMVLFLFVVMMIDVDLEKLREVDVEHHHHEQEQHHHRAHVHQHQHHGEELRLDQQPDRRRGHEAQHQQQRRVHRVAGSDHPECRQHQDGAEQVEQHLDQHDGQPRALIGTVRPRRGRRQSSPRSARPRPAACPCS